MGKKTLIISLTLVVILAMSALSSASGRDFYSTETIPETKETNENEASTEVESNTVADDTYTNEETTEVFAETTEESEQSTKESVEETTQETTEEITEETTEEAPHVYYNPQGTTLLTRIMTPKGYERAEVPEGSFADFVLNYPLKEHGAPVKLYNGTEWDVQYVHAAVFDLPLENEDFQQCADSIMRIYAEYYWHTGQQEKIAFHCTNGFLAEYTMWREGYRFSVNGGNISWVKTDKFNDSYYNFTKYMRMVFAYAGTLSMDRYESTPISMDELQIGDVWLEGDSPGHVIMVADICYDENGKKAFLLADGHTPAMDFHIMKNLLHKDDPWYYEDEITYPFDIFVHTYMKEADLQRLTYLK